MLDVIRQVFDDGELFEIHKDHAKNIIVGKLFESEQSVGDGCFLVSFATVFFNLSTPSFDSGAVQASGTLSQH
jgi:hypothetical protein